LQTSPFGHVLGNTDRQTVLPFRYLRPQSRDPNDETVLEAAINGQADVLVTYNVKDFAEAGERFRISVLRPGDLLKKVKA